MCIEVSGGSLAWPVTHALLPVSCCDPNWGVGLRTVDALKPAAAASALRPRQPEDSGSQACKSRHPRTNTKDRMCRGRGYVHSGSCRACCRSGLRYGLAVHRKQGDKVKVRLREGGWLHSAAAQPLIQQSQHLGAIAV